METNSLPIEEKKKPLDETTEKLNRWYEKWTDNKLGWHLEEVHNCLKTHGEKFIPVLNKNNDEVCSTDKRTRIFFPLCGKTVDMAYLATLGHVEGDEKKSSNIEVVGLDGIRKAIEEFITEHPELEIQKTTESIQEEKEDKYHFERFIGKHITLLKGDFFSLNNATASTDDAKDDNRTVASTITGGKFHTIFDRGSMVAIDPELRKQYVDIMSELIISGGKIVLVAIDRRSGTEEARKKGPPYSISKEDVHELYGNLDWVKSISILEEIDEFEQEKKKHGDNFMDDPDFQRRFGGVTSLYEVYYLIEAKE